MDEGVSFRRSISTADALRFAFCAGYLFFLFRVPVAVDAFFCVRIRPPFVDPCYIRVYLSICRDSHTF